MSTTASKRRPSLTTKKQVEEFNKTHKWKKRGLSITGCKYGIHYPYIEGVHAHLSVLDDGTVVVAHGAAEIGTGTHTKVIQTVAATLGCNVEKVRVTELNTDFIPQTGWTGGSVATEGACEAVRLAAEDLKRRLNPLKLEMWAETKEEPTWEKLVSKAASKLMLQTSTANFVPLGRDRMHGLPWQNYFSDYYVWGAASAEVELDVLTGEMNIVRADVLYDAGESMNPILDIGQIEGGFVFGIGCLTQEEMLINVNDGTNKAIDTWNYKVPCVIDTPAEFHVELMKDTNYPINVRGAKGVGEPPVVLANVVTGAIREAVFASRVQRGLEGYTPIDAPLTVDRRAVACAVDSSQFEF